MTLYAQVLQPSVYRRVLKQAAEQRFQLMKETRLRQERLEERERKENAERELLNSLGLPRKDQNARRYSDREA